MILITINNYKNDHNKILTKTDPHWCRQDFQLTGSEYCFSPQNLKNPMEHYNTVDCFSKIDGFGRTRQFFEEGSRTRQFLRSKQQYFNVPLGF